MKNKTGILILSALLISSVSFMILYGCSGKGSGSGDYYGPLASAEGAYGKVGVLITDGPADDYESINITIRSVSLIPAEGEDGKIVSLFCSDDGEGYELDLLQYRDEDFLLTLNEEVPPGTYSKIRLEISSIEPVGGPCAELEVKLPSGRIELNPRGPIVIEEGETLYIRLDIDAEKSIEIHTAGNSGMCIFRPLVFVDILPETPVPTCRKPVRGEIIELTDTDDDATIDLVTIERPFACLGSLDIRLFEDTRIFNADGVFGNVQDLAVGQHITVWGTFSEGYLDASLIVIGRFLPLPGIIEEVTDDYFMMDLPDSTFIHELLEEFFQIPDPIQVNILDGTSLIAGCSQELSTDELEVGMHALVIGKYLADDQVINAAVVFLEDLEESGYVKSVEDAAGGYWLGLGDEESEEVISTVFVPFGTEIRFTGDGEIPQDSISLLACGGNWVEIQTEHGMATGIEVHASVLSGVAQGVDGSTITTEEGFIIEVMPSATLICLSEGSSTLISLSEITAGDPITCFGLETCDGAQADFHASVIVVAPEISEEPTSPQ